MAAEQLPIELIPARLQTKSAIMQIAAGGAGVHDAGGAGLQKVVLMTSKDRQGKGVRMRTRCVAAGLLAAGFSITAPAKAAIVTGSPSDHPAAVRRMTASACANLSGQIVAGSTLGATMVAAANGAPRYCKVNGQIAPSLRFEIRFPESWNGKLYYGGGGGYNGSIPAVVARPLAQGYAEVASDSGHQGDGMSAAFIVNNAEAAELFGSKSVPKVMAVAVKVVSVAFGTPPSRSYFEGCSTGGREAMMAIQRNPRLFDGVIVRAPAYNWVGLMGEFNRVAKALAAPGGAFPPAKTALLAAHVRKSCDDLDGLVDGIVANPAACTSRRLNLAALRCPGGKDTGNTCLSDPQLAVVEAWTTDATYGNGAYASKAYNLTGNEDDPMNFGMWAAGDGDVSKAPQYGMSDSTLKYYLAGDANADSLTHGPWDKERDALDRMAALNDATRADIRPFLDGGGKVIFWHGGSDAGLSVNATIDYVEKMRAAVGRSKANASTRLYVAPGVDHCEGGPGADDADLLAAIDQWVTSRKPPGTLTAIKRDAAGAVLFSRPLCEYPKYPRYIGLRGDPAATRSATSFACSVLSAEPGT